MATGTVACAPRHEVSLLWKTLGLVAICAL